MSVHPLRSVCMFALLGASAALDFAGRFDNPVITRLYESQQYALAELNRTDGIRVNVSQAASALAGLKPSYVNSLIYLGYNVTLTKDMVRWFVDLSAMCTRLTGHSD